MVWLLLPGVLLLLWLLFRKPRPKAYEVASRERDVRLENEALAKHRYDDRSVDGMRDYYVHSIDFDFPTMTALEELVSRYGGPTEYCDYMVRRVDGAKWQMLRTPESIVAEITRLEAESNHEPDDREVNDETLELLRCPQIWIDLPDAAVGSLEMQYQRFLIHWKRTAE